MVGCRGLLRVFMRGFLIRINGTREAPRPSAEVFHFDERGRFTFDEHGKIYAAYAHYAAE